MKKIIPYILLSLCFAFLTAGFLVNLQSDEIWPFNPFRPVGAREIFKLINEHRQTIKRTVLQEDPTLCRFAKRRLDEIINNDDFSHDNLKKQWADEPIENFEYIGENLARDFFDDKKLMQAWLSSTTHRTIIEDKRYTHACVMKKGNIIIFEAGEKEKE